MINDRRGVPLFALAMALATASGATDVTSFLRLGDVFASVMTGNLVLFGLGAARRSGALAGHAATALAGYIVGVALGALIGRGTREESELWPRRVSAMLAVELLLFAGFTIGWELVSGRATDAVQFILLAVAAAAMGLQSEAMRNVSTPLSTTYLTGALTAAVSLFVTRGGRRGVNWSSGGILACAALGAAAGGALIDVAPVTLPILPAVAVAGVVATAMTVGFRPPPQSKGG